uniref:BCL2 like 1 n=1 Tax=Tetraodon nigroviridis TaxID=99883 RepID=H3C2U1_TETNG
LRKVTDDFEKKLTRACGDLSSYLPSKISHQNFNNTMDQIFEGNVHWGVVIGLFVVGGAMCVQCVRNNHEELVCHIADWMTAYLDEHLEPWIQRQGGWEDFTRRYETVDERSQFERGAKLCFLTLLLVGGFVIFRKYNVFHRLLRFL